MTAEERSERAKKVVWTAGALIAIILVILGRRKLTKEQRESVWLGTVVYFFAVLAWLDYTVVIAGPYWPGGLMPYWLSLATIYIALAFIVTWHAFMETDSVRNAARHGLTVLLFLVGAFADWFFFLWAGYVDDLSSQWWWMWQHMAFGYWNGYLQIIWSACMLATMAMIWTFVRDVKK